MKAILTTAMLTFFSSLAMAQTPMSPVPLYFEPSIPARIEAMPRGLPRARGPGLMHALQLARAAVDACMAMGEPVSVRVADSVGTTVVMLSGDGAGERSQLITKVKVAVVATYRMTGSELAEKADADPKLAKAIHDNPNIVTIRGSALKLMSGSTFVGVLAVSGAPGLDQTCAQAALDKFPMPTASAE